jgi:hypothetical protein
MRSSTQTRTSKMSRWLLIVLMAICAISVVPAANAYPTGISGRSQTGCNSCHGGGIAPTVTITGPTSVNSGATNTYTLTITGGQQAGGGLDVSASTGTFAIIDTMTKLLGSDVVHNTPKSADATGAVRWTFNWTAPTVTANTTATIYGAGLSADLDGSTSGDASSNATLPITVLAPVTKPTMAANPTSLAFAYTIGGAAPASKTTAITSSGTAVSYTVSSSAAWLSASPNGTTPGTVTVSVNPSGLAAGTYNGNVTITSSGASNSPLNVPVTFVVSPAPVLPTMAANPTSLAFAYTIGGAAPASKTTAITSSGTALNYTVGTSAAWLTATPSGTTPGTVTVSVNPSGLAAGTYTGSVTISASGASNSPQTVGVTLTVTAAPLPPATPTIAANPTSLAFAYQVGGAAAGSKSVAVTSSGAAVSYTTSSSAAWLSATPSGTTPGNVMVSVNTTGLAAGTYNGTVTITASGASNSPLRVGVTLVVTAAPTAPPPSSGGDDDDDDHAGTMQAWPYVTDRYSTRTVTAAWVNGAGEPVADATDPNHMGLVLSKTSSAKTNASAGAMISGVKGLSLKEIGFDYRANSTCGAQAPRFIIVTGDGVTHHVGGCAKGAVVQPAPATGWVRVRFDVTSATQAFPPISTSATVKSIRVVLDQPGLVVLDNIDINGTLIGHGSTSRHD